MISLIVAYDLNRHIGSGGELPWGRNLPADLRHFKELTMGHLVVMGRKTYESIPARFLPLTGRSTLVLTRDFGYNLAGCSTVNDPQLVIDQRNVIDEIFIAGGGEVYDIFLPYAQRVYATEIYASFEGDTTFPLLPEEAWQVADVELHPTDSQNHYPYHFVTYERIWDDDQVG